MTLPSKELLTEVLESHYKYHTYCKGKVITDIELNDIFLDIYYDGNTDQLGTHGWVCVDIYELMYLMKVWALSAYNLELVSAITEEGAYCLIENVVPTSEQYDINQVDISYRLVFKDIIFDANTEFEAVTQSCEWILNKEAQNDN